MPDEKPPGSAFAENYLAQRRDLRSSFGYGLGRRTRALLDATAGALASHAGPIDVADFGCAEGAMLQALAQAYGPRFRSGIGLDVFRSGRPPDDPAQRIRYLTADLFRGYPYPLADASVDVVVASAFMKHHPDTGQFLGQVARVLRPGGVAVLLDPRPAVVKAGMRVGRFNPDYNPSLWSGRSIERLLAGGPLAGQLRVETFQRYWLAPNHAIHRTGVETLLPRWLIGLLGLHQCLVLRRT